MTKFCSLFSGSSGNCAIISSGGASILVDAGMSAKSISRALDCVGVKIKKVAAVFVTHEHIDHIRGLRTLIKRYKLPVFANAGTTEGIVKLFPDIDAHYINEQATGESVEVAGMLVTSFATSHDSRESVGYRIHTPDDRVISIATDLGYVSDTVLEAMSASDLVMIESNHDVDMLKNGGYPYFLKRRILSQTGHLSNDDCAFVLPSLVRSGTKNIVLAHLSKDNNLPELAVETSACVLGQSGISLRRDCDLEAAPRGRPSRVFNF
jgi:phosphoribosyl 1,2-cyclic phosphodiesterase